jgi:hypothetical protein
MEKPAYLDIGGGTYPGSTRIGGTDDGYRNTVQRITNGCVSAPSSFFARVAASSFQ